MNKTKNRYHKIGFQVLFFYFTMSLTILLGPLLIVLLTRVLSVDEWGIYSIFHSTKNVLSVLLELGAATYIITKFSGETPKRKKECFTSLNIFFVILLSSFVFLFNLPFLKISFLKVLNLAQYQREFSVLIWIIVIATYIRVVSSFLVADKRIILKTILNFFNHSLWIILLGLFFLFTGVLSFFSVILIWLIGTLINLSFRFITLFQYYKDFFSFNVNKTIIKNALLFGTPLIGVALSSYILTIGDRYVLSYYEGPAIVGFYSLAYSLVFLIFTIGSTVPTVMYPYIADAWKNEKDKTHTLFNISLKYGLIVIIPASFGLFVLRKSIVTLVSGTSYISSATLIPILIFFPLFNYLTYLFTQHMTLREKTKKMALFYFGAGAVNVILNIIFIPIYGMFAAAATTIFSYVLLFFLIFLESKDRIKWDRKYLSIGKMFLASLIMAFIIYFIPAQIYWQKIIVIIFGALFYFGLLFLLKTFVKEEIKIFKHFLSYFNYKEFISIVKNLIKYQ